MQEPKKLIDVFVGEGTAQPSKPLRPPARWLAALAHLPLGYTITKVKSVPDQLVGTADTLQATLRGTSSQNENKRKRKAGILNVEQDVSKWSLKRSTI